MPTMLNNNRTIDMHSNAAKHLATKTTEAAQDVSTTLSPMQGTQLVRTVSPVSPPNIEAEKPTQEMVEKQKKI